MKKILTIASFLLITTCFWSCEEDNLDPVGNWSLTDPELMSPNDNATVVLDQESPTDPVPFTWNAAVSSEDYQVRYTLVLDSAGSEDFSTPLFKIASANGGKDLQASPTARQIDQALSVAGYEPASTNDFRWAVIATSLSKTTVSWQDVKITRFLTEDAPLQLYLAGSATEAGEDVSSAIAMKAFKDGDGNSTGVFELYTSLDEGGTFRFYSKQEEGTALKYGGADGDLTKNGDGISAPATGTYRVTVDFNENTYTLLPISKWSVVGDIINGGWGGDEPLTYEGNSVWKGSIELVQSAGFVFRANGDWGYLLKRIQGTANELVMESQAEAQGLVFEDIPSDHVGQYIFTLNLSADKYTYTIEEDDNVSTPAETPEQLFLLNGDEVIAEFTKEGDIFKSEKYLALQKEVSYTFNSSDDGSGTSYTLMKAIGETSSPDGDAVTESMDFGQGSGNATVARDQAYQLTVNFSTGKMSWKYYNLKLFHWDDPGGGWDARDEFPMTYVHPYGFETTVDLKANYDMKFISPWDVEMGADDPSAMSGTMTNKGGANFKNVTSDGTYKVTITVADDYSAGSYDYVKQ